MTVRSFGCCFLVAVSFWLTLSCCCLPGNAQITAKLDFPYLSNQFDWAVYVEVADVNHYLRYKGSRLHPLTKVRIYFRSFRDDSEPVEARQESKIYEDLWYYESTPIGSRRMIAPVLANGSVGAVVIANLRNGNAHAMVATNAALRTIVDFQLAKALTGCIIMSPEDYDLILGACEHYGFVEHKCPTSGKHMSLILRTYPRGRDEQIYSRR